ncbi:hypothetical protein CHELA20_11254 [Hyphomicrobiales bacterium]|jgi:hypothetical protein|nr:hypothetical protein CHELA20_11254 [Hyphomicrobiales bacterium]CAH1695448.1 hypothetical protein CHELA41_51502 [Hyphomicrobiales bacterium]
MATPIMSAKLNDIDPQAWLAGVLPRIADSSIIRLAQLLRGIGQKHWPACTAFGLLNVQ